MEFNGAVLVDNKKIQSAIENYLEVKTEYLAEEKRCQEVLAAQIDTLSRWEKFWICKDYKDWAKVYHTKYANLFVIKDLKYHGSWLYRFYKIGLLSKHTLDKCRLVGEYDSLWGKGNLAGTLKTFISAGEPAYLNEEQAEFVVDFCVEDGL